MRAATFALATLLALAAASAPAARAEEDVTKSHALSLFGDIKYGPDFTHFDYVNPDAPKGGTVRYSAIGTFDTLNPYTLKGVPAAGLSRLFDTLMARGEEEPASEYGLVAESADVPHDRTWVQ